jgi:hypothetical protein
MEWTPSYNELQRENRKLRITLFVCACAVFVLVIGLWAWYEMSYKGAAGVYFPVADIILIKPQTHTGGLLNTAAHEIGHEVFYTYLNASQRHDWEAISAQSAPDQFVTWYAKTDTSEDFAESFASIVYCHIDVDYLENISSAKAAFMYENMDSLIIVNPLDV